MAALAAAGFAAFGEWTDYEARNDMDFDLRAQSIEVKSGDTDDVSLALNLLYVGRSRNALRFPDNVTCKTTPNDFETATDDISFDLPKRNRHLYSGRSEREISVVYYGALTADIDTNRFKTLECNLTVQNEYGVNTMLSLEDIRVVDRRK